MTSETTDIQAIQAVQLNAPHIPPKSEKVVRFEVNSRKLRTSFGKSGSVSRDSAPTQSKIYGISSVQETDLVQLFSLHLADTPSQKWVLPTCTEKPIQALMCF